MKTSQDEIENGMSSSTGCQQCSDDITEHDSKPTYTSNGEITGRVCDSCRLKNVEHARRCQLTACKNRNEGKPTAFRMLPAKFYSLKDGEIKIRLIKQFGINCETKACCNVCYLGLSKAISQLKMMYGDEVMQKDTAKNTVLINAGRIPKMTTNDEVSITKPGSPSTSNNKVSDYQGPQFKLNCNTTPDFRKQSSDLSAEKNTANVDTENIDIKVNEIVAQDNISTTNGITIENGSEADSVSDPTIVYSDGQSTVTTEKSAENNEQNNYVDVKTTQDSGNQSVKLEEVSDFDNFIENDNDDSNLTKSPPAKRQKRRHEDIDFVKFDYFVSCIGCQKICSVKEAKAAYDYEQGYIGRLCNDCRMKRREENKHCSILGCETPATEVVLRPTPPSINTLKGRLKGRIWSMFGITKDTKLCCKPCWKKITTTVKAKLQEVASKKASNPGEPSEDNTNDSSFTVCLACHHIVKSKHTYCLTVDGVADPKILCMNCVPEENRKKGTYTCADEKNFKTSIKTPNRSQPNGICQVTNCVSSGTPTVLVSCERLIRRSGDDTKVREKFNLAPGNNLCCRSCLQRVKWFMIELLKAKHEYDAVPRRVRRPGLKSKHKNRHNKSDDEMLESPSMVNLKSERSQGAANSTVHRSKDAYSSSKTNTAKPLNRQETNSGHKSFKSPDKTNLSSKSTKEVLPNVTSPVVIPQTLPGTTHPPIIQVGGQQLILSVIHRCDKGTQTHFSEEEESVTDFKPTFASFVSYLDGSIANKNGIKQSAEKLFNDFILTLDDLSGGHGRQLLVDVCFLKESIMVSSYRKILTSVGEQYRKLSDDNAYERLRLLSLVALHTPNDILKVFFTRMINNDLVPVSNREIDEARRYAKQFGAGIPISNLGKVEDLVSKLDKIDEPSTPDQSSPHCSSPLPRRHGDSVDSSPALPEIATETVKKDNPISATPQVKEAAEKPVKKESYTTRITEKQNLKTSQDNESINESVLDSPASSNSKRTRTHFSREERELLELYFQKSPYMSKVMYSEIKKKVSFDKKKVDTWFRNRRSKAKRDEYDIKYKQETENQSESTAGDQQEDSPIESDNESSTSEDSGNFKDLDVPEPDLPEVDVQPVAEPEECINTNTNTSDAEEMEEMADNVENSLQERDNTLPLKGTSPRTNSQTVVNDIASSSHDNQPEMHKQVESIFNKMAAKATVEGSTSTC